MPDTQKVIQAILTAVNMPVSAPEAVTAPVVCISRDVGSSGDEIAAALAKRLGVPLYDREVLDRISERLNTDPHTLTALDQGVARWRDLWLFGAVGGGNALLDDYRRHLIDVVTGIGRSGGVVLGRGAHLVLAHSGALKVRIAGSVRLCAERLARSETLSVEEAKRRVIEGNKQRDDFLRDTFHVRPDDCTAFDLVICTDRLHDVDRIVDLIVAAGKVTRSV